MSTRSRTFSPHTHERHARPTAPAEHAKPSRPTSSGMAGSLLQLQRTVGNQVVNRLLQRDDQQDDVAPAPADSSDQQDYQSVDLAPVDQQLPLSAPDPIPVSPEDVGSGMGDYEVPDESNVAMAKRAEGTPLVQRQDGTDGSPHLGPDTAAGGTGTIATPPANPRTGPAPAAPAPWTVTSTIVLRDFNIFRMPPLHLDFGHEPSLQFQVDPASGLSAQAAIALINLHWLPPWHREVEASISPFVQGTLVPLAITQIGAQAQVEQHVTGTLSITLTGSGAYQPPVPGQQGGLNVTGGAGLLLHWDWDKIL
jgi:hypothetical protein